MRRHGREARARPWLWLVRLIGVIVPRRLRADWWQEWEAELQYREALITQWGKLDRRNKLALLWQSVGAFMDALWLQPRRMEDEMFQDLRFGVRMLLKSPALTIVAILSLAIGIGANTALFSVVNAVMWRSLPYPHAERLMRLGRIGAADFVALREANNVFDGLAAWRVVEFTLTGRGAPEQFTGLRVTPEFLSLFGVTAQVGRAFTAEEFQPGYDQVAIISDRVWRNRFGADRSVIGQVVTLDERSYTVIGVAPPSFEFFHSIDLLTPHAFTASELAQNGCCFRSIARIKPGTTLERAQQELAVIASGFKEPDGIRLHPLREWLVRDFRMTLLALWGVVGFVLLIACANLANMMLARAAGRQKELAVRAAVGARRLRLIRQLLTESVVLALLGGALGALLAYCGVKVVSAANPVIHQLSLESVPIYDPVGGTGGIGLFQDNTVGVDTIPRLGEVAIDFEALVFTFILALLTGMLFGMAPALQFSRPDLIQTLKEGAAGSVSATPQNLLVIGEVALALALLAGAGLLTRSVWRLQEEKLGFEPKRLLTLQLTFPSNRYRDNAAMTSFVPSLNERLAALPGVESVGASDCLPLLKKGGAGAFVIEGKTDFVWPPPKEKPKGKPENAPSSAFFSEITPHYIRAMGIQLRQGREFDAHDNQQSLPVVIINEAMAHRYWPGENLVGKRLKFTLPGKGRKFPPADEPWRTVVGVTGNVKRFALENPTIPEIYLPMLQPLKEWGNSMLRHGTFVQVRGAGRPEELAEAVRRTVWSLDRDMPIQSLAPMQDWVAEILAPRRFNMLVFGVFAVVALLLAAVGIYGVMAYRVAQRTHEIGIRMALGATSRDVLRLVVGQGMILTLVGVAVGTGAALALTRVLKNLLFGVSATDPVTFAGIALLLISVAFIACYVPARRATKVDPLVALRHE